MIYIDRDRIPIPQFLLDGENPFEEEILFRLEQQSKFKQARFKRDDYYIQQGFNDLMDLFYNKCAYCESIIEDPTIDHFRPSDSATDRKGHVDEGYFYLAYTWFNLYLSCYECQRYKANNFPVFGERIKPPDTKTFLDYESLLDYISEEQAVMVDPCDRKSHKNVQFNYNRNGYIHASTEKAEYTIELLQLNRPRLVNERLERIDRILNLLNKSGLDISAIDNRDKIVNWLREDQTHLGLNRKVIVEWYFRNEKSIENQYPGIGESILKGLEKTVFDWRDLISDLEFISNDGRDVHTGDAIDGDKVEGDKIEITDGKNVNTGDINTVGGDFEIGDSIGAQEYEATAKNKFSKFLEWVEITDYKCIEHLRLEIPQVMESQGEQSILLIGENGVGKSTVLQAISLAMMGNNQLKELNLGDYKDLIRYDSKSKRATIVVKFLNEREPVWVEITPTDISSNRDQLVKPTVGVGSVRRMPEDNEKVTFADDPSRILGLFRHDVVFPDVQTWLSDTKTVNPHLFDEAAKTIIDMLMIPDELISEGRMVVRRSGNITVNVGNGPESIKNMCDGYRSVIGYALYIMRSLNVHWESAFNAEGLIIIDEIGNHLHPTWKIKVVSLLRQVFPRCTLMISTHDPLCLRDSRKGEVWVMNMDDKRHVHLLQKDIPMGMSIENLLIGDWFYMEHTTDTKTSKLFENYNKELFKEKPNQKIIKDLKSKMKQVVMKSSTGLSELDYMLDYLQEVKKTNMVDLSENEQLRDELSKRMKDQMGI